MVFVVSRPRPLSKALLAWALPFALLWILGRAPAPPLLAGALAFFGGVAAVIGGAWALAPADWRLAGAALAGALAGGLCAAFGQVVEGAPTLELAFVAGIAQLCLGLSLGAVIGRQVRDPAWIWPLALVAAAADVMSVMSPEGPTQQIVAEGPGLLWVITLLHLPANGAPIPTFGIGDVVFSGFLMAAAVACGRPRWRGAVGLAAGFGACFLALWITARPTPALPFIGPAVALALWTRPRPRELLMALGVAAVMIAVGIWRATGGS